MQPGNLPPLGLGQPDPAQFDRAVQLAAAFVANGDIRFEQDAAKNTLMQDRLARLIADLYETLNQANKYRLDAAQQRQAKDGS